MFVSIVNVFVTIRNNKAQIQAQIISSSRVQWIKEVREIYSNFIKLSTEFHNELLFLRVCDNEENFDKNFKYVERKFVVKLLSIDFLFSQERQ